MSPLKKSLYPINGMTVAVVSTDSLYKQGSIHVLQRKDMLKSICFTLSRRYSIRINLQKADFFLCWFLFLANALCIVTRMEQEISTIILRYTLSYVQASIVSRKIAYAFDLSNAIVKMNTIPDWLKLHHSGVLLQHITFAFILRRNDDQDLLRLRLILCVLASQASHNTWTKRFSLAFYWGNAFGIGVTCSVAFFLFSPFFVGDSIAHHNNDDVGMIATFIYLLSLITTVRGMLKLVAQNNKKIRSQSTLKTVA